MDSMLPRGMKTGELIGSIPGTCRGAARKWEGCGVYLGTTDSIAGFIGATSGMKPEDFRSGLTVVSLGSTLAIKQISDRKLSDDARGVYSHVVPWSVLSDSDEAEGGGEGVAYLAGGASQAGCYVLRDLKYGDVELKELSSRLQEEQPEDYVKNLYPLPLSKVGERFPVNDAAKRSNVPTEAGHLSRSALLHSVLYGIGKNVELEGYKVLRGIGGDLPFKIISVGGGAKNDFWTKLRNDLIVSWLLEQDETVGNSANVVEKGYSAWDSAAIGASLISLRSERRREST